MKTKYVGRFGCALVLAILLTGYAYAWKKGALDWA